MRNTLKTILVTVAAVLCLLSCKKDRTPDPFDTVVDLSESGTANCYIVSKPGTYKIKASVKGNSSQALALSENTMAEVLWETNGTGTKLGIGDIIAHISYSDGYLTFKTRREMVDGNALIAVKDNGKIVWSWHIWSVKDFDPASTQQTYNKGDVVMDRNLGALNASVGDIKARGLLYQWGRKDPFPGGYESAGYKAAPTVPAMAAPVQSVESTGTVDYAVSHPTTFIMHSAGSDYDWMYTHDNKLWASQKTMYDPCPVGWRVPDGPNANSQGLWAESFGGNIKKTASFWNASAFGMDFSKTTPNLGPEGPIWYPGAGSVNPEKGTLESVGSYGAYWTCNTSATSAYMMYFYKDGQVDPNYSYRRASGASVRCVKIVI